MCHVDLEPSKKPRATTHRRRGACVASSQELGMQVKTAEEYLQRQGVMYKAMNSHRAPSPSKQANALCNSAAGWTGWGPAKGAKSTTLSEKLEPKLVRTTAEEWQQTQPEQPTKNNPSI